MAASFARGYNGGACGGNWRGRGGRGRGYPTSSSSSQNVPGDVGTTEGHMEGTGEGEGGEDKDTLLPLCLLKVSPEGIR
uniref:Uncharacterized protein n=1 Tax=Chromera velia CCMP2878 TaxID=1169474 RepID=A0A0K6S8U7_9ALVE|eukprot:Cvel_989.t1-p1 / transcript=Cvel_989.t1 / gene=Cvel_989 / organism=Chromera_velia_CCMP2878 / gene_product=hypothetical protein / transcript_product=hypothetical protein / location=Cvel_scaffold32:57603-57836(-) / protein_length=78 / sequence_SO=supercontig / SO=protein_coding / is_pseudo=false